jgi:predicted AlkP superfamily phosphohydrolase/phosphomutase
MVMPKLGEELAFYDVKGKKKFKTKQWKMVTKKGRKFAVAKAPTGIDAYRILGKA